MNCSKKMIITGANGLIGRQTIEPLKAAGFDVYALTIDEYNPDVGVNWIRCNIFDETAVQSVFESVKPQYLLNLAWCTTNDYLTSNLNFDFLTSGMKMLKYFQENGGKRVVFAGTCFEYEFKDEPLKEYDAINPQTVYAKCKNYLRELAQLFCEQNGIEFAYGRIFYVFGANEHPKRLTAVIVNNLKNDIEVVINNGDLIKDYMYTKDIAGGFVKLLDSQVCGIVNICTGKGITLREYANLYAQKLGKEKYLKIKKEDTNQPPIIVGDNHRLTNEVGYKIKYSTQDAVSEILKLLSY